MTETQGDQVITLLTTVDGRLQAYYAQQQKRDGWLMLVGVCLLVLVFLAGVRFWGASR